MAGSPEQAEGEGNAKAAADGGGERQKRDNSERNRKKKLRAKLVKQAKRGDLPAKGRLLDASGMASVETRIEEEGVGGGALANGSSLFVENKSTKNIDGVEATVSAVVKGSEGEKAHKKKKKKREKKVVEKWPGSESLLLGEVGGVGASEGPIGVVEKTTNGDCVEQRQEATKKRRVASGPMIPPSVHRRRKMEASGLGNAATAKGVAGVGNAAKGVENECVEGVAAEAVNGDESASSSEDSESGESSSEEAEPPPRKATTARQGKPSFVYGNYSRYYGYRFFGAFDQDPRLKEMEASWFAGRRLLDIGCHEGIITLALVSRFHPSSALGVDIDPKLIERAGKNKTGALRSVKGRLLSCGDRGDGREAAADLSALQAVRFTEGSAQEVGVDEGSVDVITLLSVTKWIHLHAGDKGMKAVFKKLAKGLAEGGVMVVEPQPWKSYGQAFRKQVMPETCFKPSALKFKPNKFSKYLQHRCGLNLLKSIAVGDSKEGFNRPIYVFRKPKPAEGAADVTDGV